jgi:integrase
LENHIKTKSPYIFPGRAGGQRVNIAKQVKNIKEAAGLPDDFCPLHGLRHVYASMPASSGKVGMYGLQKLLTHSDPKTTPRYPVALKPMSLSLAVKNPASAAAVPRAKPL